MLLTALQDPIDTLVDPRHAIARHRSMRASFDLAATRLSPDARDLLVILSGRPAGAPYDDLLASWPRPTPLPRTVSELYRSGHQVNGAIEPGDLVFFATVAPGATHVGIAIGGDEFVHAPSSTGEVRVERMSASYWSTRFVGARRVL